MALIQMRTFSKALMKKTNVVVILPTPTVAESQFGTGGEYYKQGSKCKVLYAFHGTFGDSMDYLRFSRIESYAQTYKIAIVLPEIDNSCFNDIMDGPKYKEYITEELPQIINWTFPVSNRPEDRYICGISMSGMGAVKLAMEYPELYSVAVSLSGAFDIFKDVENDRHNIWSFAYPPEPLTGTDYDPYYVAEQCVKKGKKLPKLYICVGTEDPYYPHTERFKKHLERLGVEFTYHEQPGGHDWNVWDDEIKRMLEWLPDSDKFLFDEED